MKFAKFFRTLFFTEHLQWLLLQFVLLQLTVNMLELYFTLLNFSLTGKPKFKSDHMSRLLTQDPRLAKHYRECISQRNLFGCSSILKSILSLTKELPAEKSCYCEKWVYVKSTRLESYLPVVLQQSRSEMFGNLLGKYSL